MPIPKLLLTCLLASLAVLARAEDIDPYEGEVVVADQSEAERTASLGKALAAALVRLTGRADAGSAAGAALSRAPELLRRYRYRQETDPARPGQLRTVLVARFDPAGLEALLAEQGLPIWPSPRPTPVVWLAIDDGRGPRLLGDAQSSAVAALTRRARERGLSLSYPLLDLIEQQRVPVAALWQGDSTAAREASARYQTRLALIGRLYRSASGWTAEWALWDGPRRLGAVSRSAPDAATVLAEGADLAADLIAAQARVTVAASGPDGRYPVWVEGVGSAEDYVRVMAFLGRSSVVRGILVQEAEGDRLRLELDLRGGLPALRAVVEAGDVLAVQGEDPAEGRLRVVP